MAKVDKSKSEKAAMIAKLWQKVGYTTSHLSCGNCLNADRDAWDDDTGVCKVLGEIRFPIKEEGICKFHSSLHMS